MLKLVLLILILTLVYVLERLSWKARRVVYSDADHDVRFTPKALRDPVHGLSGKPDYVFREKGSLVVEEVKSGRAGQASAPRFEHLVQLGAYFLLVEREYGERPAYGRIRYRDRTFQVPNSEALRGQVLAMRDRYERVARGEEAPHPKALPETCRHCPFVVLCPAGQDAVATH